MQRIITFLVRTISPCHRKSLVPIGLDHTVKHILNQFTVLAIMFGKILSKFMILITQCEKFCSETFMTSIRSLIIS